MNEAPMSNRGSAPGSDERGSLAAGVGLAWAVVVGGHLVLLLPLLGFASRGGGEALFLLQLVPLPAAVILAVVLIARGRSRTGAGVFLGLASIVGVALLLVAACFGLVAGNFH